MKKLREQELETLLAADVAAGHRRPRAVRRAARRPGARSGAESAMVSPAGWSAILGPVMTATPEPVLDVTVITGCPVRGAPKPRTCSRISASSSSTTSRPRSSARSPSSPAAATGRTATAWSWTSGPASFIEDLSAALADLRASGVNTRVLFLDASDETLVRRFETTRRRHPLAVTDRVHEGIQKERALLGELKGEADVVLDTSELNVHELRERLVHIFSQDQATRQLQVSIVSFGFKHGLPLDVDNVFDCRFLPNPHWVEELRPLDGRDAPVRDYVLGREETQAFLDELRRLFELTLPAYEHEGKSYLSIAIGCTGGRHRSVAIAEALADLLAELGPRPQVRHRDVDRV